MHRRRHHPQQRRRVPCATEPARPPREEVAPPSGPYIDLSNPAEPKLVGDLPAEFQEFGRILLQQATKAAHERDATAAEPCESLTSPPALPETAGRSEPSGEGEEERTSVAAAVAARARARRSIAPPVAASVTSEPSALISAGQYRTRDENRVEIARLTIGDTPPPAERTVEFEVRHNWMGRAERWYTAEEVAHHRTPTDLWLIAHGKVYDVTRWVEMHPGGAAALLRRGGLDATRDFDFHTKRAREMWEKTFIGKLDDGRPADWSGWFMS